MYGEVANKARTIRTRCFIPNIFIFRINMSKSINQQILLKSYPTGEPKESDFAIVETEIPELGEGEILNRTIYLSLDPYMRGRMSDRASYAAPSELGKVIGGSTVVKSNHSQFAVGDFVVEYDGRQAYGISNRIKPSIKAMGNTFSILILILSTCLLFVFGSTVILFILYSLKIWLIPNSLLHIE